MSVGPNEKECLGNVKTNLNFNLNRIKGRVLSLEKFRIPFVVTWNEQSEILKVPIDPLKLKLRVNGEGVGGKMIIKVLRLVRLPTSNTFVFLCPLCTLTFID